jgi:hypothetical protein
MPYSVYSLDRGSPLSKKVGVGADAVGPCKIGWDTMPPVVGNFQVGDRVYNTAVVTGGPSGWICTQDGSN